jgi:hypothetical protein
MLGSVLSPTSVLAAMHTLRPYGAAGIHAQRWYDVSAEALFLSHSSGLGSSPLTTLGVAPGVTGDPVPSNQVVLRLDDADDEDKLKAGLRLSAAFIFGAGGNIEGTYMGGNKWNSEALAADPSGGLFSFISDFGRDPINGFDDTDRSLVQSIASKSEFHSGELNYRRRTVGPYGRFQSSWLIGLRYVRFENGLLYSTRGFDNNGAANNGPTFFSSNDSFRNNLFGPQAGFDLWWNMTPGVNLGIGMKGAWVQNDIDRRITLTANSLNSGAPGVSNFKDQDTTIMGEFEGKAVYRLSHSWTLRSAYYVIAADDIAIGTVDRAYIQGFIDPISNPQVTPGLQTHSLVVQGFSFGAEYIW